MDSIPQQKKQRRKQSDWVTPKFHLPYFTLEKIIKVIIGYTQVEKPVKNADLSERISINVKLLPSINGFLVDMEIIDGGRSKKGITPVGKELGKALQYSDAKEQIKEWREIVNKNIFFMDLLKDIKQFDKLSRVQFQKRIFAIADYSKAGGNHKVGAIAVIRASCICPVRAIFARDDLPWSIASSLRVRFLHHVV